MRFELKFEENELVSELRAAAACSGCVHKNAEDDEGGNKSIPNGFHHL